MPPSNSLALTYLVPTPPAFSPLHNTQEWRTELKSAMKRVHTMREQLTAALVALGSPGSWEHITSQIGMFSYTGLTKAQSERMVSEFHVYMLNTGRINMAGLSEETVPLCAKAIHACVTGK